MQNINLFIAFILELIAFFGFAATGFALPINIWLQITITVLLFVLLVTFWSRYMSPKAPKKVGIATYYLIKFVIYSITTATIYQLMGQTQAIIFFALFIVNEGLLFRYNKRKYLAS